MTIRLWFPVVLLAFSLVGCGEPAKQNATSGPTASETASDVAEMLKEHFEATKKSPSSAADLTDAPASHPVGHAAVSSQEYVVFWKTPLSAAGSGTVLAYQKDVPTSGGSVIMQDGSVKTMTAEEFKVAPKAKK